MKLTFLGTSHGVPEPGRKCSSLLVTPGKNRYVIDMGTDVMPELINRNLPIESIKGVFISHPHGDHMNGLTAFTDLINWYFKQADPEIFLPDEGGCALLKQWCEYMGVPFRDIRLNTVKEGVFFDDGTLKVTAIPTKHSRNSASFLLEGDGKRVLHTGDLSATAEDLPVAVLQEGVDCLIGECAHFPITKYPELVQGKQIGQLIITHHYPPKSQDFLSVKKELSPLPVTLVYDGMEFEL